MNAQAAVVGSRGGGWAAQGIDTSLFVHDYCWARQIGTSFLSFRFKCSDVPPADAGSGVSDGGSGGTDAGSGVSDAGSGGTERLGRGTLTVTAHNDATCSSAPAEPGSCRMRWWTSSSRTARTQRTERPVHEHDSMGR